MPNTTFYCLLALLDRHVFEFDVVLEINSLDSTRELLAQQEAAGARFSLPGR